MKPTRTYILIACLITAAAAGCTPRPAPVTNPPAPAPAALQVNLTRPRAPAAGAAACAIPTPDEVQAMRRIQLEALRAQCEKRGVKCEWIPQE